MIDSGDNPFASLPTTDQGIPRITIPLPSSLSNVPSQGNNMGPAIAQEKAAPVNNTGQVPYVAGASNDSDTVNIDPNMPRYSDKFVDDNGVMGDMYKYLKVHELEEKKRMDAGMPYEQAHKEATAMEKQAVTDDGLPWDEYQNIVNRVNQVTEKEHPTHIAPDLYTKPYQEEGDTAKLGTPQAVNENNSIDNIQKEIIRQSVAGDKRLGSVMDFVKGFNANWITSLHPFEAAFASSGASEAAGMLATTDPHEETVKKLEQLGTDYINDPSKAYIPADEFFHKMGFQPPNNDTYMTDAGRATWSALGTALGTLYGVSEIAHAQKVRGLGGVASQAWNTTKGPAISQAISMAIRKYSDAIAANPALYLAGEMLGGAGATIGGESAQDYATEHGGSQLTRAAANVSGSLAGGLMGGAGAFATVKVGNGTIRVSKWFLRQLALYSDEIASHFSMPKKYQFSNQPELQKTLGIKEPAPQISEDDLESARAAEKAARQAGDNTVEARKHLDKQVPGTGEHISAQWALKAAQENENNAVANAEQAWNKIPESVRGTLSRQQSAIRSRFAETTYPREFAEGQVNDELALIDGQVKNVMQDLSPQDKALGMAGHSQKISDGLWKAWAIGKGAMNKYWQRAPLRKQMPDSSMLKAIDGPNGVLVRMREDGFQSEQIPLDEIAKLQQAFSADSVRKNGRPTLAWMKTFMTDLSEKAAKLYASGDNQRASNYLKLNSVMHSKIAEAFPDNVPLQQARAFSKKFFDNFTRGDLGRFMQTTKDRDTRINPEDVAEKMLKMPRAFRDITSMVKWLTNNGVQLTNIKDPLYLTPGQRMALKQLQDDASQTIRQHIQDTLEKYESDPLKVQRRLNDPAFNKRIASLGDVAGEVRAASQELKQLTDQRAAIEKSALSKYLQRDPDKALDMVWNNSDPSGMAKQLMDGTAGVGGFAADPKAMQGFSAGLLDRLVSSTGGDPQEMLDTLAGPRGRLLKQVLGYSQYNRLEELVKRSKVVQEIERDTGIGHKAKIALIRVVSLGAWKHIEHLVPIVGHSGEGGSIQKNALVSNFARDIAETMMSTVPIDQRFKMALSNPEVETALYSRLPTSREEAKSLIKVLNRSIAFERGIHGAYLNWVAYGNGPSTPDNPDTSDNPLYWVTPSPAHAETTQGGQSSSESFNRQVKHKQEETPRPNPPQNFSPFRATGDIVPFSRYPMDEFNRRAGMERLKSTIFHDNPNVPAEEINKAFDKYFGGGAKILPMGGRDTKSLEPLE